MARDCSWVPQGFVNLRNESFVCASDRTNDRPHNGYNCIAYAAGDTENWWWPTDDPTAYWPEGLPFEEPGMETVDNFVKAFERENYRICAHGKPENGYEKVAIYVDGTDTPTHAARSLADDRWVSKLGKWEDIVHQTVHSVEGIDPQGYGTAKIFLKRLNPNFRWSRKKQIAMKLRWLPRPLRTLFGLSQ